MNSFASFILKALQLAVVADQAFAMTQGAGNGPATVLQPNNFNNLLLEIAQIVTPTTTTSVTAPPAPVPSTAPPVRVIGG